MIRVLYRISDNGYLKEKPDYITNRNCFQNFCSVFHLHLNELEVTADNVSRDTIEDLLRSIHSSQISQVSIGHGAGTFNLTLNKALTYSDDDIIYFVEDDYLHRPNAPAALVEGLEDIGSDFVTLYDHPDKYLDPSKGGNPLCHGGAEITKVYYRPSGWWKFTNSTTMTFAAKVKTLKKYENILRKFTSGTHPDDYGMFTELRTHGVSLVSPIPGYATHGESRWLAPHIHWEQFVDHKYSDN